VLPLLAVYIVLAMEAIGDITATCDVSRLQVDGKLFDSRIQGGVLADGLNGVIAGLCTITPMSTFAQVCPFLPQRAFCLTLVFRIMVSLPSLAVPTEQPVTHAASGFS
jgi:hypothetical protein